MKDSLFEILLNFFEKSLSKLNESSVQADKPTDRVQLPPVEHYDINNFNHLEDHTLMVKPAQLKSIRVFTEDERRKFTKASYQFLMRMSEWGVVASEIMEQIINQLLFSESRFVTLEETKWTIRNTLSEFLDGSQLAFLDLVLYQKEDECPLH